MKEIAIYGKGGIGKSTISSNLSAALSKLGKKVLQIGCDPKHDSTRLLLGGENITTVLDYIRDMSPDEYKIEDVIKQGYGKVDCVEAGGPNPGVGCAGRGILTTFDLLERFSVKDRGYDLVLYDVLGDVVCGGFAVPIRHEYADVVYIVTSGEFMSIYAANNILRGIKNYDDHMKRVGGLIFNQRGVEYETERVKRFSEKVGTPICETFPRSDEFTNSERLSIPLVEMKDSSLSTKFLNLAQRIMDTNEFYEAKPLTDEELEMVVLGQKRKNSTSVKKTEKIEEKKCSHKHSYQEYLSKNVLYREPLHGCAFNGAVNIAIQLEDAMTIAHGPKSCAHISYQTITSIGRRSLYERGLFMPVQMDPPLVSSEMNEGVMVFGGVEELKNKVKKLKKYDPKAFFLVTTCPSGIIGDDIEQVKSIEEDVPIIPIKTDGNITGDYLQGMIYAYMEIARGLIKKSVKPQENRVNILAEKTIAKNTEENFERIKEILSAMDLEVNCRYICRTNVNDIQNFMRGKVNLLAYEDYMGRIMKSFFEKEYEANFFEHPFPVGFFDTQKWIKDLAKRFKKEDKVEDLIEKNKKEYEKEIDKLKRHLKNKKLMIVTYNHNIDWILDVAIDIGMNIVKVCILNYSQDNLFQTKHKDKFLIETHYDQNKRGEDIKKYKPDIVLSNYTSPSLDGEALTDNIPLCPDVGFFSGLNLAKRWAGLFEFHVKEGWKEDEKLFSKYYGR